MTDTQIPAAVAALAALLALASPSPLEGHCPTDVVVEVDNDAAGSGYSEVKSQNWTSRRPGACQGTYRYLSHTVGDGSRTGKAIWKPTISESGWYRIVTSFRKTENRTTDADYVIHGDDGTVRRETINQKGSGDCTREDLGTVFCQAGGDCRLVLDGTDDGTSDSADVTRFELERCAHHGGADAGPTDTGGSQGACSGIEQNPVYELCSSSSTTCKGVYTNGDGCEAFCAAAGMECVARYGGEPGCNKEPDYSIPCSENNAHDSDWCECEGPPPMPSDTGTADTNSDPDTGRVDDTGSPSLDTSPARDSAPPEADSHVPEGPPADGAGEETGPQKIRGRSAGCNCRTAPAAPGPPAPLALLVLLLAGTRTRTSVSDG